VSAAQPRCNATHVPVHVIQLGRQVAVTRGPTGGLVNSVRSTVRRIVSIGVEDDDLCVIRSLDSVVYFLTSLPVHVFRTGYSGTGHFSWSQPSRFLDRRLRALSSLYPVCSDCFIFPPSHPAEKWLLGRITRTTDPKVLEKGLYESPKIIYPISRSNLSYNSSHSHGALARGMMTSSSGFSRARAAAASASTPPWRYNVQCNDDTLPTSSTRCSCRQQQCQLQTLLHRCSVPGAVTKGSQLAGYESTQCSSVTGECYARHGVRGADCVNVRVHLTCHESVVGCHCSALNPHAHDRTQHYTLCAPKCPVPSVIQDRGAADGLKPSNTS
jgi:hypothetical protein